MRDLMAKNYIKKLAESEKFMIDWLDRHVGKVRAVEDKPESETLPQRITVTVINRHRT